MTDFLLFGALALVVASLPVWPFSRGWGYGPVAGLAGVLCAVIALMLAGWL